MTNRRLEQILEFQMDDFEAKAFKVALIWEELVPKEFPNYTFSKLKKSGDPRKSLLFKYCYKFVKETLGLLEEIEYKLYVLAQLHVLKTITKSDVRIDPNILVSPKAWKRWRLWKYHYDKRLKKVDQTSDLKTPPHRIVIEFERTKKFLQQQKVKNIKDVEKTTFLRWASLKRVSPYFLLLSPDVKELYENEDWRFDLSVYKDDINDVVVNYFNKVDFYAEA